MPRAIVYASDPARVRTADVDGGDNDAYLSKLTKYVPAEVLAFFVPTYANLPANAERWHWTVFGIGLAATLGYTLATRMREHGKVGPWYHYILTGIAFAGWASSVTAAGTDLVGLDPAIAPTILSITVLMVPLADDLLTRFWPPAA